MNKDLKHILLDRFKSDTLASVYLLNYDSLTTDPLAWTNDFIRLITKIEDHPDVLKLFKDEKSAEYKVDSEAIEDLIKFTSTRPLSLSKKFLFLFDAQDLSVIVSNKLLKLLEELESHYCLFLMVRDDAALLPTVLSRAVKLTIASGSHFDAKDSIDFASIASPYELQSVVKITPHEEKDFIEQKINEALRAKHTFAAMEKLLIELKNYEEASAFNNAKLSRLSGLFS